ncbi:MAG: hypothetical protein NVS9B9_28300 [Ktedonobacteraceae bacterium]
MLLNKRIIVGICGGIASYKAVDLVSKLQQAGALVDVILTEHAEDFVRPLTFSTMSHRPVYSDLWEASGRAAETHIALAEEAELLAIVPATANTIAKLAHGIADNMLTAVALATKAPLVLAPAMYRDMYLHVEHGSSSQKLDAWLQVQLDLAGCQTQRFCWGPSAKYWDAMATSRIALS